MEEETFDDLVNFPIAKNEAEVYMTDKLKDYLNKRRIIVQNLLDAEDEDRHIYMKALHSFNSLIKEHLML